MAEIDTPGEKENDFKLSVMKLTDYYDLNDCIRCILENSFKKIALQFPDDKLYEASIIAQRIEHETDCRTYILADTSYGSCCVDKVAAKHAKVDCIFHFGPSCLTLTDGTPVYYIFGKEPLDIKRCCSSFNEIFANKSSKVLIIYEVVYTYAMGDLYTQLRENYKHVVLSFLKAAQPGKELCLDKYFDVTKYKEYSRFGRTYFLPKSDSVHDYSIFFIGKDNLTLRNYLLSYNQCQFFIFNPEANQVCGDTYSLNITKMLMKRYHYIEKAKDANIVGILIGTLDIPNYLSAITRVKKVITYVGKKYYTFVVGKLSPEKLANFLEIDIFVLIACPENSLINSKEFHKPIITPFELEVSYNSSQAWTGKYVTDFQQLIQGGTEHVELTEENQRPDISLISGRLRYFQTNQDKSIEKSSELKKQEISALSTQNSSSTTNYLNNRCWKGLDINKEANVSSFIEGSYGLSTKYDHETN